MKTPFKIETVNDDESLCNDKFYAWLDAKEEKQNIFIESIFEYVESLGYDKDKHELGEDNFNTLRYVFDVYHSSYEPLHPKRLRDLFNIMDKDSSSNRGNKIYWIRNDDGEDLQGKLKPKFKEFLNKLGVIYELSPDNYYFEIIKGKLFIRYQYIIGSRRICTVKGG